MIKIRELVNREIIKCPLCGLKVKSIDKEKDQNLKCVYCSTNFNTKDPRAINHNSHITHVVKLEGIK